MKNNFDIKTFLIENKVTRNSKIVNEDFTLGDEDMELAKQFNVKYLKKGDTIEPEMWNQESDAIRELYYIDLNKPYKITGFLEDWDGVEDMDGEAAQYVTLQNSDGKEEYEAVYWVQRALKPQFQLEVEPLDESFELGPDDMELAKQFNVKFLTVGDTITPEMWNQKSDAIWEIMYVDLNKSYKINGFLEDWDGIADNDIESVQYVTLQDSNNKEEEEAVYWVNQALKPQFQLEVEPLDLDEEFTLGDEDMELAKRLDYDPQYNLVLEIAENYDDEELLQDFLATFPVGEHINEKEFYDFFAKYVDDYGDWFYIKQNWKYVESGGDESVFDEEENDDEDELDEEFTLGTNDINDKI
jgi:hypothetical protein